MIYKVNRLPVFQSRFSAQEMSTLMQEANDLILRELNKFFEEWNSEKWVRTINPNGEV
jgi:hypothetical protein